jgi:Protein of unknown function (DUF4065)
MKQPKQNPVDASASEAKLKELILYISKKCENHTKFGATKLNKILFYADFMAYAQRGRAVTGATYFKLPMGPAPKKLIPAIKALEKSGDIVLQERRIFSRTQKRWIALREPDLSLFDGFEIALVDEVIEALKERNAESVSDLSHEFVGWQIVKEEEEIPYETVFLRDPSEIVISDQRIRKAREIVQRYDV